MVSGKRSYLCVVRSLSAIRGVFEGENRGGKFRAQAAHNTQVQGELKVGKLYFHNNSSILRFIRNGQIPNTKSYNGLHFASFAI